MLKKKTPRNKIFMNWLRDRGCCLTGSHLNTVVHHVRAGNPCGMGIKPSDYRTIPITAEEHVGLHNMGEKTWIRVKGIDTDRQIISQMIEYLIENGQQKRIIEILEDMIEEMNDGKESAEILSQSPRY